MESTNQIQVTIDYSIDELQAMVDAGRRQHEESPLTTLPTIRITSTGTKIKMELLTTCSVEESTEDA
jgi:hypothetical protein